MLMLLALSFGNDEICEVCIVVIVVANTVGCIVRNIDVVGIVQGSIPPDDEGHDIARVCCFLLLTCCLLLVAFCFFHWLRLL